MKGTGQSVFDRPNPLSGLTAIMEHIAKCQPVPVHKREKAASAPIPAEK